MSYKHSVLMDDITGLMIHPEPVFNELKSKWKDYLSTSGAQDWNPLGSCPVCGAASTESFFRIWDYVYDRCDSCASVFLNPQPSREFYKKAFYGSPVSEFVNSAPFQDRHRTRFEKAIRPVLSELIQMSRKEKMRVMEVVGRNRHVMEFLGREPKVHEYLRYEAGLEDKSGRSRAVGRLADIEDNSCDLVLMLMSSEQILDPQRIFPELAGKLAEGGLLLVLARLGSGIDVQVLRGENPSIFPLEHINLYSVEGYELLCEKAGLQLMELSTPGLLDAEYLKQYYQKHPDDSFLNYIFKHRSALDIEKFQYFVQEIRLSSALRLIARKKIKGEQR
jgi:hypothetical protein